MEPDFSGWASKAGVKCTDGRVISHGAFKDQDKQQVPLVWSHKHDNPENVLGHAVLEHRAEGVWTYGFFNDSPRAQASKMLLAHGDIDSLSIWANNLVEQGDNVLHGTIREVSLVLAGANEGAKIENVHLQHGDGTVYTLDDEAIIKSGEKLEHAGTAVTEDTTVKDIINGMTPEQQNVVAYLLAKASGDAVEHSAIDTSTETEETTDPADSTETTETTEETTTDSTDQTDAGVQTDAVAEQNTDLAPDQATGENIQHSQEGTTMTNVFDANATKVAERPHISHDAMKTIMARGKELNSFKQALEEHLQHEGTFGINQIDELFPNAKNVTTTPEWIKRDTGWVGSVMNAARKLPFSRIRSSSADITHDEARALGYIKGNLKKEEFFGLKSRVTTPATVYKKQKLDRDDIIDITEFDVVIWLKGEMRGMLEEEIARAVLLGDGRPVEIEGEPNPDKIKDPASLSDGAGIRSIANDHDFYAHQITISLSDADSDVQEWMEAILRSRKKYKGTGSPTLFTTEDYLTDALLSRDGLGRRHFKTVEDVAAELRVSKIVTVEVMESHPDILGILVNMADYSIGTDAGGQIGSFEQFDIDYNQYKYLMETRLSGALTKHKSAVVFRLASADAVTPAAPTQTGNAIAIPTTTGVSYFVDGQKVTGTYTLTEDETVYAEANEGRYIPADATDQWTFTYTP